MGIADISAVFQSAVCIALLAVVLLKLWSDARLDAFRQEMFIVRDELFDYAASGQIAFDDPAYRLLRQMMNGLIRYGHQITFFRFNMTALHIRLMGNDFGPKWSTKWEAALEKVRNEEVRDRMKQFHEDAMTLTAKRIVLGSPALIAVLALAFPLVVLYLVLQRSMHSLKQVFVTAPKFTLSRILDTQMIENEAAALAVA